MPVVNVGTRAQPIYLPADVCKVQPGQLAHIGHDQTDSMVRFARRKPNECAISVIDQGREVLGYASPSPAMVRHNRIE